MKAYTLTHWGIPITVGLTACAAAMAWLATTTQDADLQELAIIVGIALAVSAVAVVLLTAASKVKRDAADKKLSRYGCPRCGYAPHPDDVEGEKSFPCPTCGEPIYPEWPA